MYKVSFFLIQKTRRKCVAHKNYGRFPIEKVSTFGLLISYEIFFRVALKQRTIISNTVSFNFFHTKKYRFIFLHLINDDFIKNCWLSCC